MLVSVGFGVLVAVVVAVAVGAKGVFVMVGFGVTVSVGGTGVPVAVGGGDVGEGWGGLVGLAWLGWADNNGPSNCRRDRFGGRMVLAAALAKMARTATSSRAPRQPMKRPPDPERRRDTPAPGGMAAGLLL